MSITEVYLLPLIRRPAETMIGAIVAALLAAAAFVAVEWLWRRMRRRQGAPRK